MPHALYTSVKRNEEGCRDDKSAKTRKGLESYVTRCACKDVGTGLHMTLDPSLFTLFLLIYHPYIRNDFYTCCTHFLWALARRAIRACAIKTTPIFELPSARRFLPRVVVSIPDIVLRKGSCA